MSVVPPEARLKLLRESLTPQLFVALAPVQISATFSSVAFAVICWRFETTVDARSPRTASLRLAKPVKAVLSLVAVLNTV